MNVGGLRAGRRHPVVPQRERHHLAERRRGDVAAVAARGVRRRPRSRTAGLGRRHADERGDLAGRRTGRRRAACRCRSCRPPGSRRPRPECRWRPSTVDHRLQHGAQRGRVLGLSTRRVAGAGGRGDACRPAAIIALTRCGWTYVPSLAIAAYAGGHLQRGGVDARARSGSSRTPSRSTRPAAAPGRPPRPACPRRSACRARTALVLVQLLRAELVGDRDGADVRRVGEHARHASSACRRLRVGVGERRVALARCVGPTGQRRVRA